MRKINMSYFTEFTQKSQEIDNLINSDNLSLKTDDIRRRISEIEKILCLK